VKFTADQIDQLLYTSFLIVGPYKTGKTQSCATLHKLKSRPWVQGKKLYIYDFDEGCQPIIREARKDNWVDELTIFRFPRVGGEKINPAQDMSGATVLRTKEPFMDFLMSINGLYDHVDSSGAKWKDDFVNEAPYAIVVDSLTAIQDDILGFTLSLRNKQLGVPGPKGFEPDGRQEYGMQMGKIVETVRAIRALPCFFVLLAHEQTRMGTVKMPTAPKGADPIAPMTTGVIAKLPVVTGQLANTIGGEFGAVLFTGSEPVTSTKSRYFWITRPDGEIRGAGTRLKEGLDLKIDQNFDLVV